MNSSFKPVLNCRTTLSHVISENTCKASKTSNLVSKQMLAMVLGLSTSATMAQTSPIEGGRTETITTTWNVGGDLTVGNSNSGTLLVQDGGAVTNTAGYIGRNVNSNGTVTVTGTGSTWTNANELIVGNSGTGTLNIENGGNVTSRTGDIGRYANSTGTGTVSVTGTGSTWTNANELLIGSFGTGTLNIENGGNVANTAGYIGRYANSTGTVSVTGTGSTWTNANELHIGSLGTGTLNIENSGNVASRTGDIGREVNSNGTVTVTGSGSTWTNAGELSVGNGGIGTLNIESGGNVANTDGYIGRNVNSNGTVTVTGPSSTWTNSGMLTVGYTGNGTLIIKDGATVTNGIGHISSSATSNGAVTVTGSDSTWTNANALHIGSSGTGTLNIESGGNVANTAGYIGGNGNGTVTVTGSGSTWTNANELVVGNSGTGTLNIENGGNVANMAGYIGRNINSNGTVTVTGSGSTWTNSGMLTVGHTGNGTLIIKDGAAITNTVGDISSSATSNGAVTVTGSGSTWTNSDELLIGSFGTGTLNIENGGNVANTAGYIGRYANSTGTVSVTGTGSTWTNANVLHIGSLGTGTLNIENGGNVTSRTGDIGRNVNSNGTVTVTGSGSTWTNANELVVGNSGTGTLNIENGGNVANMAGYIGSSATSNGAVTVTGSGSTWTNANELHIGSFGTGTLNIENGGNVANTAGYIGRNVNSTGTVTVTGSGSTWTNANALIIGNGGSGSLTINNRGKVSSPSVVLGTSATGIGTLNLDGTNGIGGTLSTAFIEKGAGTATLNWNGGTLQATANEDNYLRNTETVIGTRGAYFDTSTYDVGIANALQGAGGLTKSGLGTLTLSGVNTYAGDTRIDAGKLRITDTGSVAGRTIINSGGTLSGNGSVGDLSVNSGGILTPGNSIGTLTVNGDLTFNAGGIYQVEANPSGDSDQVIVNGIATLAGSVVALPREGAIYQTNTRYTILTATSLNGSFNPTVSSSLIFLDSSLTQDENKVYLNLQRNDITYESVAQGGNQQTVANALQNASGAEGNGTDMDAVITAINNLSTDEARTAFTSTSGAGHISLRRASTNFTNNFSNQLIGRLQSVGMGSTAQSISGIHLAPNDRMGLMPALAQSAEKNDSSSNMFSLDGGVPINEGKRGFWLRGFGFNQHTQSDGNAAASHLKGGGITAGFDTHVRDDLVVGVAFSHARSDIRASSSETGRSHGNAAAFYANYANGPWNVNGNLALAHSANRLTRDITVGAINRTANARFNSKTLSAYGEVSYDLPQATWVLQPLAGLGVTHDRNDRFNETGAGALNIRANAQNLTSTKTVLGARALFEINGVHFQPRAIWAHEFGDINKAMTARLQGSQAATFATYGVDLPRDSFITGLTIASRTKNGLSLFADVQGEFSSKQTGVSVLAGLRKSW